MKVITLTQPWATLVVSGLKTYETRSWSTTYRGQLLIHAARSFPQHARRLAARGNYYQTALRGRPLPLGVILGQVDLIDCQRTEDVRDVSDRERAFGNFAPHRWAWRLANPVEWPDPVAATGALGLWDWPKP